MSVSEAVLGLSGSPELSMLLKATVLLAVGCTVAGLARRAKASTRHLVLTATFAGILALPLAVTTGPSVEFGIPNSSPAVTKDLVSTPVPSFTADSKVPPAASSPGWRMPSWPRLLGVVWVGFAVLQLHLLGLQLRRVRVLRRAGIPWLARRQFVQSLAQQQGIQRPVEILLHEAIPAPLTCGMRHPAILLPVDAPDWSEEEIRRSLVHELEHVRRKDWATQLGGRVAVALYWFHPLVWIAWRRLCLEAERACDDAVAATADGAEYAAQLVGLAQRISRLNAQPALGMAYRSELSVRVSALLDRSQKRGRTRRAAAITVFAAAILALVGIAPLTAIAQSSRASGPGFQSRRSTALDRALYEASEAGDLEDIDALLNAGANINAAIRGDGSPLIGAARKGRLGVVVKLLERGADPNMPVSGDGNPLIMAAAAGHTDVVSMLLDRGARIEEVVPGDENALIQASGNGRLEVVKLLIHRRANINVRLWVETSGTQPAGEWRSPLSMARKGSHQAVVDLLVASGASQ